jgi:alginate O-acetyltransferase complex protein AlgI
MVFASFEFLCLFLPLFLVVNAMAPARLRNLVILVFSYAFYAWWRVDFLVLLMLVTGVSWAGALAWSRGTRFGSAALWGSIGLILVLLCWFKYANLAVDIIDDVRERPLAWQRIVLPVGLSFYVLQSVSYLVDVRRGTIAASASLLNFASYKAMFSQLVAGPVVRYATVAHELVSRAPDFASFGLGARRFMVGFAMKVLVADTVSGIASAAFALASPTAADAWLGTVAYTLQIYFDFAGYSAMAVGLGLMMGFHLPENFDEPYTSVSLRDFWRRWHITLSTFLRDYLYIPMGGSRHGAARTALALVATMALGGLWHGANLTFLAWGLWHGVLLAIEHRFRATPGRVLTLLAVMLGWVMFRADNFHNATNMYAGLVGVHGWALSDALAWRIDGTVLGGLLAGIAVVYRPRSLWQGRVGPWVEELMMTAGFALAILALYHRDAAPFLYFQF